MPESHDRLVRCFSLAFPALTETEIRSVDAARLLGTDSLAGVSLIALIDEEFGVDMDIEGLLDLGTFEAIQEYLRKQSLSSLPSQEG